MQAARSWTPPTGTLGRIVAETETRVAELKGRASTLREAAQRSVGVPRSPATGRALAAALRRDRVAVIAEVKRKSPSKGWIAEGISAVEQARAYENGGAAAISVLTEPEHFHGSIADLESVAAAVAIPVLKKDFHVDPIQLVEAVVHGASAALLIARALEPGQLKVMLDEANSWKLDTIVEIRDEMELETALSAGATVIGINNRNLETLEIDPSTSERLLPLIPRSVIAIAESGMSTAADVERVAALGADAVLVGSSISAAANPAELVRQLSAVRRVSRA